MSPHTDNDVMIWTFFLLDSPVRGIKRLSVDSKHTMMTSSNGNIFRVTGPLCGEFTGPGEFPTQKPVTRSFDVFFDLRLNKRLSKQPWGWWFETTSWSLWRHRNANNELYWDSLELWLFLCCLGRFRKHQSRSRCWLVHVHQLLMDYWEIFYLKAV